MGLGRVWGGGWGDLGGCLCVYLTMCLCVYLSNYVSIYLPTSPPTHPSNTLLSNGIRPAAPVKEKKQEQEGRRDEMGGMDGL